MQEKSSIQVHKNPKKRGGLVALSMFVLQTIQYSGARWLDNL